MAMDRPLTVWALITLRLAAVLLAIAILPALAVQYLFTGVDALVPALLLVSLGPVGAVMLVLGIILFLVAQLRKRQGPS
jgi:hypothetical protein